MHEQENEFSFKSFFVPFTTLKAIHWIIVIGLVVYINSLFNGFVWDDITYILQNSAIHTFNIGSMFGPSLFNDATAGYYRPIPASYFTLLYMLFNNMSFFYHMSQILLHILCTSILFLVFNQLFDKKLAFFLALIFLVHPVQVESVSFIAQTVSPLFFLFGIIALLLSQKDEISLRRVFVIFSFLLFSILAKETGVVFLFACLLYRVLIKKRNVIIYLTFGFITSILYFAIRFGVGGVYFVRNDNASIGQLALMGRILNIPAILFYYLKTFFFPIQLVVDQRWVIATINFSTFYFPLLIDILFFLILGLIGFSIFKTDRKRFSLFLFFALWFLLGIAINLQIFSLDMTVADRWFYFPIVGLLGMLGIGIQRVMLDKQIKKAILIYAAIILVCVLSLRTIIRNANWHDEITLFTHDSKISDNYDLELNLSVDYFENGLITEAFAHARKSVALSPQELNLDNLGTLYLVTGNLELAKKTFQKSLNLTYYATSTHKHLRVTYKKFVWTLLYSGEFTKAYPVINEGVREFPKDPGLWYELAVCEYKLGYRDKALVAAEKAKSLDPNNNNATYLYTQILNKQSITVVVPNGTPYQTPIDLN